MIVTQAELRAIQADIASLEDQVATAKLRVDRFGDLFAQGFAARHKLEDQTNQLAILNAQLTRARNSAARWWLRPRPGASSTGPG